MPGWVIWLWVDWCRPCYKYQKSLYSVKRMYGPDEVRGKQLLVRLFQSGEKGIILWVSPSIDKCDCLKQKRRLSEKLRQ